MVWASPFCWLDEHFHTFQIFRQASIDLKDILQILSVTAGPLSVVENPYIFCPWLCEFKQSHLLHHGNYSAVASNQSTKQSSETILVQTQKLGCPSLSVITG